MRPAVRRFVDRAPDRIRPAVELAARTVVDALDDRVPGLAAEMAFYLILSLPPLLITVFAGAATAGDLAGVELLSDAQTQTVEIAGRFLTDDTIDSLVPVLEQVRGQAQQGIGVLLSFGFLLTLLSASRALRVTTVAITIAYDLEETRPGWQQFLYGIVLAFAALVLGAGAIPAFVAGPGFGAFLVGTFGAPAVVADAWRLLYWPGAVVVVTLLVALLYHVAAPWYTPWRRDLPGAALAMVIALAGSFGLRVYTDRAVGDVFGALAAPVVLLIWLYLMSFAILLGAELNAELERMWPHERPDQPDDREATRMAGPDRRS